MKWNHRCRNCHQWHVVDWSEREKIFTCPNTNKPFIPPTPLQQTSAYVDTHAWPLEMEQAVVYIKGKRCTVPECNVAYQTLDHRVPYSKSGRTSVDNLFPMCIDHNQSKGDTEYSAWLQDKNKI